MDQPEKQAPVINDVLQSDHHVHMTDEEVAKARAHHAKRHGAENPQNAPGSSGKDKKKIPGKPR